MEQRQRSGNSSNDSGREGAEGHLRVGEPRMSVSRAKLHEHRYSDFLHLAKLRLWNACQVEHHICVSS